VNDAIVGLIVDFAHTLGLKVTAEGVKNDRRQVASLRAMSCDLAQGFHFSRPLPSQAAEALVATNPFRGVSKWKSTLSPSASGGVRTLRGRPRQS
jgi:EAL domain-containing protein (putative c-di-GMP-specific phosphodiesterase class I)